MPIETLEQITELRESARHLYEWLNTDIVIVSPCDRATHQKSSWVFDESFDALDDCGEFADEWEISNREHHYGRLSQNGVQKLWKWCNAGRLECAEVVFGYPASPELHYVPDNPLGDN